jgi:hypothetical protein
VKLEPSAGEAVNVTVVASGKLCEHEPGQPIPPPDTLPDPPPPKATVRVWVTLLAHGAFFS